MTKQEDTIITELRRRNAELESENEKLRSEIAQFRQRGRRLSQGHHEVLPVVVEVADTVDLSRVDESLVVQISSFLGSSRELLNLGLTCKSFGWRQSAPTSAPKYLSLVEEVARGTVSSSVDDSERRLLRCVYCTTSWLSVLHKLENLRSFNVLLGGTIEHRNGDETTVCSTSSLCTALSSSYVMRSGSHYAEFKIIAGDPIIGVVRPMPGLDDDEHDYGFYFIGDQDKYPKLLSERSYDWGRGDVHACEYSCHDGKMSWTNWDVEHDEEEDCVKGEEENVEWDGMECCGTGDVLGMLLDLDEGLLIVCKNDRCLGVMKYGLSGPYCWYVGVAGDDEVKIQRGTPPVPLSMTCEWVPFRH